MITKESILHNLKHGLSVEFIINEIKKSIKEYKKMKLSNTLFKSIDISPFLNGELLEMYENIELHIGRNETSVFKSKEKEISLMKEAVLEYAKEYCGEKEFESIQKQLSKLNIKK